MDNQVPPTSEPQSITEKSTKKRWLKWIAIGILLILGIFLPLPHYANPADCGPNEDCPMGWYLGKSFLQSLNNNYYTQEDAISAPRSQLSPTPDPTADWKIYKSPTGAYEIIYPHNLETRVEPTGDTSFIIYLPSGETFTILTYTQVKPYSEKSTPNGAEYIRKTKIGGKLALEFFTNKSSFPSMNPNNKLIGLTYRHFSIQDTEKVMSIEIGYFETPESKKIFNQILSTFKFTDSAVVNYTATPNPLPVANPGMKIYSTTHGFNFQYPDYFILNNISTSNTISFLQQQNDIKAQRLLVDITKTTQSLEDFVKSQTYGVSNDDFPISQESLIIDGHQAIALTKTFSMQEMCGTGSSEKMKRTSLLMVKGADFIASFIINDSCYTLENDWFSQIPPTIKFTK